MVDFACKQIELIEIIKCSFSLNKTEYKILIKLLKHEHWVSIVQISKLTGFERSTVQKAIKNLVAQLEVWFESLSVDSFRLKHLESMLRNTAEMADNLRERLNTKTKFSTSHNSQDNSAS